MKCSRKREDLARKIVMSTLGGVIAVVAIFLAIVFTKEFLIATLGLVATSILVGLVLWLSGEISFCKGVD